MAGIEHEIDRREKLEDLARIRKAEKSKERSRTKRKEGRREKRKEKQESKIEIEVIEQDNETINITNIKDKMNVTKIKRKSIFKIK